MAHILRSHPKISANKLAEYVSSKSPLRRKKILRDQKYPKNFIVTRYKDARATIVGYFLRGKGDKKAVEAKIAKLLERSYSSTFKNQDNQLSIQALQVFAKTDLPDLTHLVASSSSGERKHLTIRGVKVTIVPEVYFRGTIGGKPFRGAVKINLSKGHPLDRESATYVATLLKAHLEDLFPKERILSQFCLAFDVFSGEYFPARTSYKTRKKELEAACEEIRSLWPAL